MGDVLASELPPLGVAAVVPGLRVGRAGEFVNWVHPVSAINAMAMHGIRNALDESLGEKRQTEKDKSQGYFQKILTLMLLGIAFKVVALPQGA